MSAPSVPETPYRRVVEAAELLGEQFGIEDQVARLREAGLSQEQALRRVAADLGHDYDELMAQRGKQTP